MYNPNNHVGAGVLIVDVLGNAIVNMKDGSNGYPFPNTLSLFGGALEPYELKAAHLNDSQQAELALKRELCEEIIQPRLVTQITNRLICLDKMKLPGGQIGHAFDFWPFLCLVDTHTFGEWYELLFSDGSYRQGIPRKGLIRPNEGSQHYVPAENWHSLLKNNENFLGSLEIPIQKLLQFIPNLKTGIHKG